MVQVLDGGNIRVVGLGDAPEGVAQLDGVCTFRGCGRGRGWRCEIRMKRG